MKLRSKLNLKPMLMKNLKPIPNLQPKKKLIARKRIRISPIISTRRARLNLRINQMLKPTKHFRKEPMTTPKMKTIISLVTSWLMLPSSLSLLKTRTLRSLESLIMMVLENSKLLRVLGIQRWLRRASLTRRRSLIRKRARNLLLRAMRKNRWEA